MHHQEKIIFSPGGQKQCLQVQKYDVKNQIYLSLSPMFCRWTFPSKLKVLKTNVICYMAKQEQVMCSTHVMVQRIFSSWPLSPTRFTTFFGGLWNLLDHSLKKSPFILSKGLLCFYDNQNKTWLFVVMSPLFPCPTRYREIITVYILMR